jgi:NADH-quinone oxidoreductase subunit H
MNELMTILYSLTAFLIFPGLVFTFVISWIYFWFFRKIRARLQSRRGPPWYQPLADIIKLFSKESIIPATAQKPYFIAAPLLAFGAVLVALMLIPVGFVNSPIEFIGDIIVVIYLLMVPPISAAIGGLSSSSPYGAIGASRELNLLIGYEIAFATAAIVPALAVKSLLLSDIVNYQVQNGWLILRFPLAAIALLICIIAKLGVKPFDIPDARQEIVSGSYTEYTGPLLGTVYITKMFMWFVVTAFFVDTFLGGGDNLPVPLNVIDFLVKCLILVFILTVIEVANARYRIDQAFSRYLVIVFILALIDLIRITMGWLIW